ncbi:hypothetical protein [Shinella zoogloeoides]|uniref:hypothetical protein n=1 Tax=Shinella zoogloeoides TaxID=352475 RepID=UPI001F56D211|nr:hypothetical protein [Shinella zoogloeoides]
MSQKPNRTSTATATAARPSQPLVTFIGSDKGGVGKSFITTVLADLMEVDAIAATIVQIDDQNRLPALYPGRVTTVLPASMDDLRRDPTAIVAAFDPFYSAFETALISRVPMIVDIGGPQQTVIEEYLALVDLDADLIEAGVCARWLIPTTAEPEAMRGAVRTAHAIGRILPSVTRHIVLNRRDGPFRFYPNSPADLLWKGGLEPLCLELGAIDIPAIAPGSWQPFEAAGKRPIDVVAAEIDDIRAWTGRSRPAAKVLRGDVAAFLAAAKSTMASVTGNRTEAVDEG